MKYKAQLFCGAFSIALSAAAGVNAQTATAVAAEAPRVSEVVVTAQKRSENLQRVPVAVTAVQGADLARKGITSPSQLSQLVPSLSTFGDSASTGTGFLITLRGQSASDVILTLSQAVGLYEDGVNIPHPEGSNLGFFDLERVEVLKGPQGTLYGRNTTGGAINILTRNADYGGVHGFVYGEIGNFSDAKAGGAVNIPIIDDMLAIRIAYQHWNRDGFGHSAITGEKFGGDRDDDVARLSVKFDPTPSVTMNGKLEYFRASRNDAMYQTRFLSNPTQADAEWALEGRIGGIAPSALVANTNASGDLFTNYSDRWTSEHLTGFHGVLDASWHVTDDITLRSISGYHQFKDFRSFDMDALPLQAFTSGLGVGPAGVPSAIGTETRPSTPDGEFAQFTQELNLSGQSFDEHLKWLVGGFYSNDVGNQDQTASVYPEAINAAGPFGPFDVNFHSFTVTTKTWAVFTQNDVKFNDMFSMTLGARYTEERLGQNIAFTLHNTGTTGLFACQNGPNQGTVQFVEEACGQVQRAKFSGTSYLVSLNAQVTPNTLVYLKTSEGFRGGALQVRAPNSPPASPEKATDYEIGVKTDLFDHRLRANLAAYRTKYANKQETAIVIQNGIQTTPISNAASAVIKGVEFELTAVPIEGLTLSFSGSYIDPKYKSFPNALSTWGAPVDASGAFILANELSPWKLSIGGRYEFDLGPGRLSLSADYNWRDAIPATVVSDSCLMAGNACAPLQISPAILKDWRQSVGLLNARIDYELPDKGLTFSIFSTNLLDKHYQIAELRFANFGATGLTQEPLMFGVAMRKTFGEGD